MDKVKKVIKLSEESAKPIESVEGLNEIKKDIEEKFFDINKKLEQTKSNFMGEITRVENKKDLPPPPMPIESGEDSEEFKNELRELKEELLSRIEELENNINEFIPDCS